ncbi:hypothetical protein V3C99_003183 [Haemonchus contortus]
MGLTYLNPGSLNHVCNCAPPCSPPAPPYNKLALHKKELYNKCAAFGSLTGSFSFTMSLTVDMTPLNFGTCGGVVQWQGTYYHTHGRGIESRSMPNRSVIPFDWNHTHEGV